MGRRPLLISVSTFLLLLVMIVIFAAPSKAQNDQQVQDQLNAIYIKLSLEYNIVPDQNHRAVIDSLATSSSFDIHYHLLAGKSYLFFGVCDAACTDLDLRLYDKTGIFVGGSVLSQDHPAFLISPKSSGEYYLVVTMAACYHSRCSFGVDLAGVAN